MRHLASLGTMTLALTLALAPRPARAEVRHVGPTDPLPSAIAALGPGDELVLASGTYTVDVLFQVSVSGTADAPIVIRGEGATRPVITRSNAAQNLVNVSGQHLVFRGLEFVGGSRGLRFMSGASHVTVEDCRVHDMEDNAISANDHGGDYAGFVFRHNEVFNTGGTGEAFYLGCNNDDCQFHDSLIEGNWIHDTNGPAVSQGDGIEIKEGSYGNVIRDNVIHDTNYPCIITYSTVGNGPPNVIERNLLFRCGDHAIQSAADVVIRNNIILGAAADGIHSQHHQSGDPANIEIVHNTILKASGDAIRMTGITGSILVANNAIYASGGRAIRMAGALGGLVVSGNVGTGTLEGVTSGFDASGELARDFVGATLSGGVPNDVFPRAGSALVAAGDPAHVVTDDFDGTSRGGIADVGAYAFGAGVGPGWALAEGFKPPPTPITPGDPDAGMSAGEDAGVVAPLDAGSIPEGVDAGRLSGADASSPPTTGGEASGCGCRASGRSAPSAPLALALALVAVLVHRRRRATG